LTRSGRWDCDLSASAIVAKTKAVVLGIDQLRTVGLRRFREHHVEHRLPNSELTRSGDGGVAQLRTVGLRRGAPGGTPGGALGRIAIMIRQQTQPRYAAPKGQRSVAWGWRLFCQPQVDVIPQNRKPQRGGGSWLQPKAAVAPSGLWRMWMCRFLGLAKSASPRLHAAAPSGQKIDRSALVRSLQRKTDLVGTDQLRAVGLRLILRPILVCARVELEIDQNRTVGLRLFELS
jgi:hypothetical protein